MSDMKKEFEKALTGDREAFDQLFGRCREKLTRFCQTRMSTQTRNYVDVEDVVQETAIKAFQSLDRVQWQGESALFSWFCGIAINVIYGHARRFLRLGPVGVTDEQPDHCGASPSRDARRGERMIRLEGSLEKLPPEQREVVTLIRLQGLSVRQAAAKMERSEKATYQLLWRAMKKLRELFGDTESFHLPPDGNLFGNSPGT